MQFSLASGWKFVQKDLQQNRYMLYLMYNLFFSLSKSIKAFLEEVHIFVDADPS